MTTKIKVLVMATDEGNRISVCATDKFPIDGENKEQLREAVDDAAHFTESIIKDQWLIETEGEESLNEEFSELIDTLAEGKDAEYFDDLYKWEETTMFN